MKLMFTRRALSRLDAIVEYYFSVAEPHVAHQIHKDILGAIDKLPALPFQGQLEPYLAHRKRSYRRLVIGNYKVIYRVAKETIYITDVFDSRQSPKKM